MAKMITEGGGGVENGQNFDYVICERSLKANISHISNELVSRFSLVFMTTANN